MPSGYPNKSVTVTQGYKITTDTTVRIKIKGVWHTYRVWFSDKWYWEAGGRSESAESRAIAETTARRWLRDAQ